MVTLKTALRSGRGGQLEKLHFDPGTVVSLKNCTLIPVQFPQADRRALRTCALFWPCAERPWGEERESNEFARGFVHPRAPQGFPIQDVLVRIRARRIPTLAHAAHLQ